MGRGRILLGMGGQSIRHLHAARSLLSLPLLAPLPPPCRHRHCLAQRREQQQWWTRGKMQPMAGTRNTMTRKTAKATTTMTRAAALASSGALWVAGLSVRQQQGVGHLFVVKGPERSAAHGSRGVIGKVGKRCMGSSSDKNDENKIGQIVNLERFPITDMDEGGGGGIAAKRVKRKLEEDGYCVLDAFVTPSAARKMKEEVEGLRHGAFFYNAEHNVWGENPGKYQHNSKLGTTHLRRRPSLSAFHVVGGDELPEASPLLSLFRDDNFAKFLDSASGGELARFADEIGSCSVQVMSEDSKSSWRFAGHALVAMVWIRGAVTGGGVRMAGCDQSKLQGGSASDLDEEVRTLLDASEVEDEVACGAGAPDITFEEILGSMDEECGARISKSFRELKLKEGSLVLWAGGRSLMSVSSMFDEHDFGSMLGIMRFDRDANKRLSISERRHLYGREFAGEDRTWSPQFSGSGSDTWEGEQGTDQEGNPTPAPRIRIVEDQSQTSDPDYDTLKMRKEGIRAWQEEFGEGGGGEPRR